MSKGPRMVFRPSVTLLAIALLGAAQRQVPQPPENYFGLDAWFGGEIVELADSNGAMRLRYSDSLGIAGPGLGGLRANARGLSVGESESWVELRYAKGWIYFDDPESDGQRRFNLRDGRRRLRPGHLVEIGRYQELGGGHEVHGGRVRLEGWVLVRVSPGPNMQERQF
ncbi:MAG: hypothetical protein GKS06_05655 [Acidobacteria bacterium]|nr:hypothetical protein [Acidobacteriota bacterium]